MIIVHVRYVVKVVGKVIPTCRFPVGTYLLDYSLHAAVFVIWDDHFQNS